jgi:hypothetical protein
VKRPLLLVVGVIAAACWVLALGFVLLDPFYLYPWSTSPKLRPDGEYSMQSTPYVVDAAAKAGDVDTLFLGTSTGHFYTAEMMEHILPDTHHSFNLSYSNPSSPDRTAVARQLLLYSHARRFILEADWTYMIPIADQHVSPAFPLYLYDTVWWNDVRGMNADALKLSSAILRHEPLWINKWSQTVEHEGYGRRYESLHSAAAALEFAHYVSLNKASVNEPSQLTCASMTAIHENLVPFVRALSARAAEVDLIFPVYSWVLYYWTVDPDRRGLSRPSLLNDQLLMRRCIVQALDGLPGVRIFAFDDVPGLASDMRNYFDPVHLYNSAANRYVLKSIANDEHRMTVANVDEKNDRMRLAVIQYRFLSDRVWRTPVDSVP